MKMSGKITDRDSKAAVLREACFHQIQTRENLEARNNRAVELARVGDDFPQFSIDAKTYPRKIILRLDMNARCAFAQREVNQIVYKLNQRIRFRELRDFIAGQ